ncbi:MAG: NERD domain-containing protein [Candidatus Lokiarchaeota archaeon]|nr:NERD domain-containing protein [Candidatus Lokiarchaeota archaeon]
MYIVGEEHENTTDGERLVRKLLDKFINETPDFIIGYYDQPMRTEKRPDFVLLSQKNGIFVFEVKDFSEDKLKSTSDSDYWVFQKGVHRDKPYEQLYEYRLGIEEVIEKLGYETIIP